MSNCLWPAIGYEGRMHSAEVKDRQEMDTSFEDAFIGYNA